MGAPERKPEMDLGNQHNAMACRYCTDDEAFAAEAQRRGFLPGPHGIEAVDVVAAVRRDEHGRYWLCRRDANGKHGELVGMWEYPGGRVEPGEQLRDALRREMDEEFGVEVEIGRVLDSIDDCMTPATGETRYRVTFFEVTFIGEPELRTHTEARWMTPDEVCRLEHLPAGTIFNARHLAGPSPHQRLEELALKAIEAEPEFPGEMPDGMWGALQDMRDRDAVQDALRICVQLTKQGIRDRFLETLRDRPEIQPPRVTSR